MKRRRFIALTSALPLATAGALPAQQPAPSAKATPAPAKPAGPPQIPPLSPIPGPPCLQAGPMLCHVGPDVATLWIRTSKPCPWTVEIDEDPDFRLARALSGGSVDESTGLNAQIRIDSLQPGTRYHYRVLLGGLVVSPAPAASFVTAPAAATPGKLRVAFSSCVGRLPENTAAAWGEIAARQNFDLFLMLGDNHYGDSTDLERQRLYHTAHRMDPAFRHFSARIPLYGIWDDHDYGPNDSDGSAAGKERSLQAFREFFGNPPRSEEPDDPAIYYHFQRSDVAFFMLDVRWHRSPNSSQAPAKTMLGLQQLAWLKRALKASTAKVKIIASGSEWQTHGHRDSWASFLAERDDLFSWMDQEKISGAIFLSGDRHFSAGYQIKDRWLEFTAGPLGSNNERSPKAVVSPETFTTRFDGKMWIILEIDTTGSEPALTCEIWGAGLGLVERRELTWDEVEGRAKPAPSEIVTTIRASLS
jgi:alkaline phosphatase D